MTYYKKKSNLNNMFGSVLITHQTATLDLIQEQQKLRKVTSGILNTHSTYPTLYQTIMAFSTIQ